MRIGDGAIPRDDAAEGFMEAAKITLDAQTLDGLRALQLPGQPSLVLRVLDMFEKSSAKLLAELEVQLANGDLESATRAAHTLKSSSGNIGATELAEAARLCEMRGRAGDLAGFRTEAVALGPLFGATLAAVAAARAQETG
jgi:HPt (histidine-containing phosphotransfer) domain-containing protein